MLWASTILPITPPELLAAAMSVGLRPAFFAAIVWRLPNRKFEAVSEPVSATPNQPSIVPKNGYSRPVRARARPNVPSMPEKRVT